MKISKKINSATNSCGIPAKPSTKIEDEAVTSATYDDTPNRVNEDYISQLMSSVDENLPDTTVTYRYDLGDNMISCISTNATQIAEYEVPVEDLSGIIDEDMDYILGAINDETAESEDEELLDDGRYEFIDSKIIVDWDGFNTEYSMYYDTKEDKYVFVYGDKDYYTPYDLNFDWECDTLEEAQEWFDDYIGPGEDFDEYEYNF